MGQFTVDAGKVGPPQKAVSVETPAPDSFQADVERCFCNPQHGTLFVGPTKGLHSANKASSYVTIAVASSNPGISPGSHPLITAKDFSVANLDLASESFKMDAWALKLCRLLS